MQPMYVSIQQKETGNRIKSLLKQNGYTVKDIQGAMGFENPQAVYKWLSGRSLPSIDNFIILSRLLHTSIEDILVIDGDIVRLWSCYFIFIKSTVFQKIFPNSIIKPSFVNQQFSEI
ncbi:helix-turn-helix transcriptional regulator [uncultured Eubacterium sp.]|uniref:helix-turn-helix domain-containing protein n=1 Tax=uncultured Eubacterium sp. TaxID=165185 RepID=UPI0025E8EEC7|nr:helix-turn-helix transcriptional regulator [uncultured Eubacterium sp.]